MTTKIKMRQYVILIEPQKFDTADIKCFTVPRFWFINGPIALLARKKNIMQYCCMLLIIVSSL